MQNLSLSRLLSQPLNRAALALILGLTVVLGSLVLGGDQSSAKVREFTWDNRQVGAEDSAFILTFNRPMDRSSVNDRTLKIESNLKDAPAPKGKLSWSGRRMAYTFDAPIPYGYKFNVSLKDAKDRSAKTVQPFQASFRSRDRMFAYIGADGDEAGRLMLFNFTTKEKKALTPQNLTVMDFQPYPLADKILFSAISKGGQDQTPVEQKIYTVTTGIAINAPKPLEQTTDPLAFLNPDPSPSPLGQVNQLLDNREYQNLKFDLSSDGQTIVVQRISRKDPNDSGQWILREGQAEPTRLDGKQPGGDFLITPKGDALAIAQGQGLAILPLQPNADPLDFLPKFGTVLGFSRDGLAAAMLKFNPDYTKSLFLVTNQGKQQEVVKTTGSILSAQFDPDAKTLYCLLTNLVPGATFREQPYLAAVDLQAIQKGAPADQSLHPLVLLPNQRDIQVSLSPDGLALLFDQTASDDRDQANRQAIANSRLWLLPLSRDWKTKTDPQALPMPGFHPRWLP
jgi:hypothetical protein